MRSLGNADRARFLNFLLYTSDVFYEITPTDTSIKYYNIIAQSI